MATPESIAIRRADALTRVERALGRIGEQTGIEVAPYPEPHKRPEVRPAIEAEWLADALEAIANAGEVIEGQEFEVPDYAGTLQHLVMLAVDNEAVRTALVDAGFIQAKGEGDDVAISVVGLGPDLFAEPTADAGTDGEQSPTPTDDAADESANAKELEKLTRAELDVYANHLGIENADKLPNKDAVLAAIKAAS